MTSKEKRKGTYHENCWVSLFKQWNWSARRQPLSGILKDFPNDIELFAPDNREEPKKIVDVSNLYTNQSTGQKVLL